MALCGSSTIAVTPKVTHEGTSFSRTIYVGECYLYTGLPPGTSNSFSNDVSNNCQPRALPGDQLLGKFVATPRELQFYRAVVLLLSLGYRSLLIMPVVSRGESLGIVEAYSKAERPWTRGSQQSRPR